MQNKKLSLTDYKCKFMALICSLLFVNHQLFAQSDSVEVAAADTALNKTTKTIFQEASKSVGSKDALVSIVMIVLVLAVVFVALYLSFKSPNNEIKRKELLERQQKRGHQSN